MPLTQDAVSNRFEFDKPLPDDLAEMLTELEVAWLKVQLVGSEEVRKVTQQLNIQALAAVTNGRAGLAGEALNACDSIRATSYCLIDLMRAELTSNKAAVSGWHRRPPGG